ncbi:hypothetical protein FOL47_009756 [Perkinsus chesapeaki]|uniref:(d)CMP kinase n=1 Tax=Perkinsus chesapeaki TaxID=330153 RepID=A0A7J6MRW9_PERCH|nr:hypothetical protein FOL47_009756 [Perkinsus chesapeaki]
MPRDWKQNDDGGYDDSQGKDNWYRNNNRGNGGNGSSSSSSWDKNNNSRGGGGGGGYKSWKKDDDWSKDKKGTWDDKKGDGHHHHHSGGGGWKSSSNDTNEKENNSNKWKSSDNGGEAKEDGSWGDKKEWKDDKKWDDKKWESNKDDEGDGGWNNSGKDWEDIKGGNDENGVDKWKSNTYEGGGNDDVEQPESEEYDEDEDAVADMEYSDDWSSTVVWVRTATVGQLEFTVGDKPQFDIPGSRPLTIPVVTGDMEKLVFVPRIESKDDEDIWDKVASSGLSTGHIVKMCMGKDSNGIIALDYTKGYEDDDDTYQNGGPTSLTSAKEFWTEGDRVLYFDSWAQLDTPYLSATYSTRQDRTSILAGHSEDRSWEGFTVGVKLINPDKRTNNGGGGGNWEVKDKEEEEGQEEEKEEQQHKANWFNLSLNGGKLNVWVPNKAVNDSDEKILIFKHTRKELSSWIIPEAWLRTGVSDTDVDEALSSPNRAAIKSMNGYAYYQQFYGTVNTLYKSPSDVDEGGDAGAVIAVPEIKEKPRIEEQIMIMSKSFWQERDGREGRLQQLREKCQVMKDYNDNLTSQLEEAQGLYKELFDKVQQMKEKLGEQRAIKQLNSFGVGDGQSNFMVLNRITVKMGRSESLCHLERLQSYDVVALVPESDAVIWTLLGDDTLRRQVDVISLDLSPRNGSSPEVNIKRGLIEAIRKAGLFIELNIGDYMRTVGEQRAEILARGAYILRWSGHGDGVIFTSGALTIMDIRSPYDIDNWGHICLEEGTHRHRRFITTSEAVVRHGGAMCVALALLEAALRKYQILPLLYNGMFTVKKRRINCFNIDITDEPMGKGIRCRAKMNLRLTMCVVLSYLWQFCVIEYVINSQGDFPGKECRSGFDCFSSPLKFETIFTRDMDPIDCDNEGLFNPNGDQQLIVNCMKFVEPNAANWLMHIAISHSLWLLVTKAFELTVWMASGNQALSKFMLVLLIVASEYADFGTAVEAWTATTAGVNQDNNTTQEDLSMEQRQTASSSSSSAAAAAASDEHNNNYYDDSSLNDGAEGMRKRVNRAMHEIFNRDTNEMTLDIGVFRGAVTSEDLHSHRKQQQQPRYPLHISPAMRKRYNKKNNKKFTIAIDGPAGSGKSAVAEMLANRLSGFTKLDSGALYRSIALFVDEGDIKGGIESLANETIRAFLDKVIFTDDKRVFIGNRDITDAIRSPPISLLTAKVAQIPQVRSAVVDSLRTRAQNSKEGVVIEGRDTGANIRSVVFPDAQVKVYLDASAEERARRRQRQIGGDFAKTLTDIKARDQADFTRKLDPLKVADGAVVMDSTGWSVEKTVDEITKLVFKRRPRTKIRSTTE